MNKTKKAAKGLIWAASLSLSAAFALRAETYQWIRTTALEAEWQGKFEESVNWQDGKAPIDDAAADINLASVERTEDIPFTTLLGQNMGPYVMQRMWLPSSCFTFNAVADNLPNQILVVNQDGAVVRVAQPNAFNGLWRLDSKQVPSFVFSNDGAAHPTLQYLQNGLRPTVNTESAETKAAVGSLVSGGLFRKTGAGDLKIENPSDLQATCDLREGSLTLGRAEAGIPEEPIDGAVCHLDASAADTLTTDDGGQVTGWKDLVNTERTFAQVTEVAAYGAPHLVTVGGKPLIDFGAQAEYHAGTGVKTSLSSEKQQAELGEAAMLRASGTSVDSVREVFIVAEVTTDSKIPVTLVGGSWQFGWRLGTDDTSECFARGDMVDPGVASGDWLVNGAARKAYSRPEKNRLLVYSVRGCFPRSFDCLAGYFRDGDTGILGGLRIGEVLAYDRELTDDERLANHRYLMNKWLAGSDRTVWDLGRVALHGTETSVNVAAGETARVRRVFGSDDWAGHVVDAYPLNKTGEGELVVEEVYPSTLPIHVKGGSIAFTSTIDREALTDDKPADGAYLHVDATKSDTLVEGSAGVTQWKDCEGRTTAMTLIEGREAPTVVASEINGQTVLDFGFDYKSGGAAMYLTDGDQAATPLFYEVFTVLKRHDQNNGTPIFSTKSDAWYFVGDAGSLFSVVHALPVVQGADYAVNGRYVWGNAGINAGEIAGFSVYSVSFCEAPVPVNALANWLDNGGGAQFAEHICYTRRLTDAERRSTIAYLMKKWGRGDHPDKAVSAVGPIDFAAGVQPRVGTDSSRAVASIASADADAVLIKTGAGALTVGSLASIAAVEIAGGALTVTGEQDLRLDSLTVPETQFRADAAPLVKVNGTLSFGENGTINIDVPQDLAYGAWKVAEAAAITDGENLKKWIINIRTATGEKLQGEFRLRVRGTSVYLTYGQRGFRIYVR